MGKVIALTGRKGGAGKTSIAMGLAAALQDVAGDVVSLLIGRCD